jgi:hypothetical protein
MSETRCRDANGKRPSQLVKCSTARCRGSETEVAARQRHGYACRVGEEAAGGAGTRAYVRPR